MALSGRPTCDADRVSPRSASYKFLARNAVAGLGKELVYVLETDSDSSANKADTSKALRFVSNVAVGS